ncbi:uncharacterized protein [Drosophila bipectinata]|uniref:uncharacterized protein n=1 Tax=Drosophila bipectinata TaxID=42026 RepID=UPI001C8A07C7|nr:uncharacterized protein LOC108120557 [Drosophila bipectinata]
MPAPFVRPWFVRGCVTLIRIIFTETYLWLLVHAAAVFAVPVKRYENKIWSKVMVLDISYSSLIGIDLKAEVCLHVMVGILLYTLYRFWCRNRNNDPVPMNYRVYVFFLPYILSFLICWAITTALLGLGLYRVIYYTKNENMWVLMTQFVVGIIFKLLILVNFCTTCGRCYVKLQLLAIDIDEQRRELIRLQSFGDHLTMLFNV